MATEAKRRWNRDNADKILAQQRARRAKNPELIKASNRSSYAKHAIKRRATAKTRRLSRQDALRARDRVYYLAHTEQRKAASRALYAKKREQIRSAQKVYRLVNACARAAADKAYYESNREKFTEREAMRKAHKLRTQVETVDLKQILRDSKGMCGICKKPLDLFGIDFDHIIPLAKGGTHTRDNIQATHSRCNRMKGAKVS